jgi:anti-anti-sigma factor
MSVIGTDQAERPAAVGIITVRGELDASNSAAFADHVAEYAATGMHLVLDLSPLQFFGTAGFSALHTINVRCANTSTRWVTVTGEAVSRLLRICDPDHTLPVADSVPEAVALLDGEPRRLLQLVAQPG